MANENGTGRLDRIEKALELLIADHVQFREEHQQLLTAQVVLTDRLDRFIKETGEQFREAAEARKVTDQKFAELAEKVASLAEAQTVLTKTVDDLIRRRPPQ